MNTHKGIGNAWKALGFTLGIAGSLTFASASSAATWRSNSGKMGYIHHSQIEF